MEFANVGRFLGTSTSGNEVAEPEIVETGRMISNGGCDVILRT
jgi:hypothetical protein